MQRFKHWTKAHKAVTAILSTLLLTAVVAGAYYLATVTFTGESTGTLGKGTATNINEPITVTMPTGMLPGNMYPFTATVKPTKAITLEPGQKLSAEFTTVPSTCKAEWFELEWTGEVVGFSAWQLMKIGGSTEVITLPAATVSAIKKLEIKFKESPTENQTVCNEAKVTVKLTVTGPGH
jgi:hypothetical protein